MPQLDVTTYFSQVTYAIIGFIFFYLIFLRFIIPSINKIIKTRRYNLYLIQLNSFYFKDETNKTVQNYDKLLSNIFNILSDKMIYVSSFSQPKSSENLQFVVFSKLIYQLNESMNLKNSLIHNSSSLSLKLQSTIQPSILSILKSLKK
uniref:ATP synthase F0 subunit 8 n=1 Tax=Glaucocystis nostochinearum TaxID=38271 RepID=E9P6D7_9EUKA|nr:ATP synthase F0 subunit 8 [Glaucocystis nostochinearum]ADW83121.1 ATP synthase F0 subunit 8 [Glaucocystis nostochinearum]